ncbi:MAG: hypothetical protein ACLFRD_03725, partial [Nitriliruptoraceae bacterium]
KGREDREGRQGAEDAEQRDRPGDGDPDASPGQVVPSSADTSAGGAEQAPAEPAKEPTPLTQQLGRAVVVLLVVLFAVFAVDNSQPVDFSWVFGGTTVEDDPSGSGQTGGVPLIVLLLIAFVIGGLIGSFVSWQVARSRRRRER